MFICRQCGLDVDAEVEAELSNIVNGPAPGQLFGLDMNCVMQNYVCLSCQRKNPKLTKDNQQ